MEYESYLRDLMPSEDIDILKQFSYLVLGGCDEKLRDSFKTVEEFIRYLVFYRLVTVGQANTINIGVEFHRKRISDPKLYDPTEESLHQDLFYYACFFLLAYIPDFLTIYKKHYKTKNERRVHLAFNAYVDKNSLVHKWNKQDRDKVKYQYKSFDIFLNILIISKFKNMDMRDIIENIKRFKKSDFKQVFCIW